MPVSIHLKPSMNPVLRGFWSTPSPGKVLHGGRMSSKSWDAAANTVRITQKVNVRVLCTRMFQNKIEESVYTLIKKQIDRFGLSNRYRILNNKIECITTGSEYLFYGLARNIDEIKSLEGIDILWIEEAHSLTKKMWEILEPTIMRNAGAEIWIIFNPRFATDFAYQRFIINPPEGFLVKQINYDQNKFLTQTALDTINKKKKEDFEEYEHVYLGVPRTNDDKVFIKRQWIIAAIGAHKKLGIKPTGRTRIGYDIADSGPDKNATVEAKGLLVYKVDQWKGEKDDLLGSCSRVYSQAAKSQAYIYYDNIGVGAGAGSKFKELNSTRKQKIKYQGFGAGNSVFEPDKEYEPETLNKDYFCNLKAQSWQLVADRFKNTYNAVTRGQKFKDDELIAIDEDVEHLEQLIDELSTYQKDYDTNGKLKGQSKKDMEDDSPNLADAFIMAYNPLIRKVIDYGSLL